MEKKTQPDSDRPLTAEDDDLFGFVGIAKGIAPAILKTFETDGMVVGLEGPWGSGKTTLLNYLRNELDRKRPSNVHVISISPWLSGDNSTLVSSLLSPIEEIINRYEEPTEPKKLKGWRRAKRATASLGDILRHYGAKTGRTLAPAVRFAGNFVPGAKVVADGLDVGSQYLESMERHPTTAEVKNLIARKLSKIDIGFIVLLDDLDRLEPKEAVEVVRMVRSVADFPRITYIMCYDRDALSHALMAGLNIADGDQFLQKIVQLTFTMPLPEPFDMRWHFLEEAKAIYEEVTGSAPAGELLDDLKSAVDREGGGLRTPREVKITLNSIRFLYPSIKDEVYFPDMCRLHLIKTTQPALYRWIEEYLAERSVLVSGDASISDHERKEMGERLNVLLPVDDHMSNKSIWNLRHYIPGVIKHSDPKECVFTNASMMEVKDAVELRRLGSPWHYRSYFALTYPKTVMPDRDLNALFALAKVNRIELSGRLVALAGKKRSSGKSWFDHVLDRLDDNAFAGLEAPVIAGFIIAIADSMDRILLEGEEHRPITISVSDHAARVVGDSLTRLKALEPREFSSCAIGLVTDCPSMSWLVGRFFRNELHAHNSNGGSEHLLERSPFSYEEMNLAIKTLRARATALAEDDRISRLPDLASYLFGWRDLSGGEEPKAWVVEKTKSDEGFLFILNRLRSWAMSDRVFYPLQKSSVGAFLDWEDTIQRLDNLAHTAHAEKVEELKKAIKQGRH